MLWLLARLVVMAALLLPPALEGSPVRVELAELLSVGAAPLFAAITVCAVAVDRRTRRTVPLLANLGVSRGALLAASAGVALLCELLVVLVAAPLMIGRGA